MERPVDLVATGATQPAPLHLRFGAVAAAIAAGSPWGAVEDPDGRAKAAAADAGVRRVRSGHCVALGTGSTAAFAIRALARRFPSEGRIETVASSIASARLAEELGIPVRPLRGDDRFDIMLDGADEVDPTSPSRKGAGGRCPGRSSSPSAARTW